MKLARNRFSFIGVRPDEPIYRVFTRPRFLQMLRTKKLVVVNPTKWQDPFETFLMRGLVRYESGIWMSFSSFRDLFYGQCWTKLQESDALWRIYSPMKNGVIVRTTPRKILIAIGKSIDKLDLATACVGRVNYHPQYYFKKILRSNRKMDDMLFTYNIRKEFSSLLIKREAFRHEQEVRVLVKAVDIDGKPRTEIPAIMIPIQPNNIFEFVRLDPRSDRNSLKRLTTIARKLGYRRMIVRSTLYDLPKVRLRLPL